MKVQTTIPKNILDNLKPGNRFEVHANNEYTDEVYERMLVEIIGFVHEPLRCAGCGILSNEFELTKYMGKLYCDDCLERRKEEKSQMSTKSHKKTNKSFNGAMSF